MLFAAKPTGTRPIIDMIEGRWAAAGGIVHANHHKPTARTETATPRESSFDAGYPASLALADGKFYVGRRFEIGLKARRLG